MLTYNRFPSTCCFRFVRFEGETLDFLLKSNVAEHFGIFWINNKFPSKQEFQIFLTENVIKVQLITNGTYLLWKLMKCFSGNVDYFILILLKEIYIEILRIYAEWYDESLSRWLMICVGNMHVINDNTTSSYSKTKHYSKVIFHNNFIHHILPWIKLRSLLK